MHPAGLKLTHDPPPAKAGELHIDLMYVRIQSSWFYLVDIIDAYSRYLVHWTLNPTMTGDTVILTVQQALDGLVHRRPDEPKVVHDSGSQFASRDWLNFVDAVGVRDIRTRVAHPQSNGVVECVHRTHRQEALVGEATEDYHAAHGAFTRHVAFYNHQRPHTALRYLPPAVYYRGDPEAKLRERQLRLATALEARKAFWADRSTHPHGSNPYHKSSVKCLTSIRAIQSGSTNIEVYGGVLVPGRVGFTRTYEAIAGPQGYLECEPLLNGCDGDFKVDVAKIFVDATNSEWQEMHRFARYQRQVITHELGHAVGLAHVEHPECNWVDTVMGHYRCFDKSAFFFTLQSHDVGDINNMYP